MRELKRYGALAGLALVVAACDSADTNPVAPDGPLDTTGSAGVAVIQAAPIQEFQVNISTRPGTKIEYRKARPGDVPPPFCARPTDLSAAGVSPSSAAHSIGPIKRCCP